MFWWIALIIFGFYLMVLLTIEIFGGWGAVIFWVLVFVWTILKQAFDNV